MPWLFIGIVLAVFLIGAVLFERHRTAVPVVSCTGEVLSSKYAFKTDNPGQVVMFFQCEDHKWRRITATMTPAVLHGLPR